ncbi:Ubiquitin-like domain-containing protein [Forsythia ovata]|uniref:Ubiquitin-like domain-containing protein n=1 Tax=Forsythia ovata TaxID=205694 RepID=A0ABD1WT75_9LAMI
MNRSLVWSHFCLCYEGQKLINEKACLQSYGIKDGDEVLFSTKTLAMVVNALARMVSRYQLILDEANLLGIAAEALCATHQSVLPNQPMRISTHTAVKQKQDAVAGSGDLGT